jgi:lysozyme family protein
MSFVDAFTRTVGLEGGYSDNPNDPGGETNWGITVAVARAHGYTGPMASMPIATAQAIYQEAYWNLIHLDLIDVHSSAIAEKMFDTAVNCGVSIPGPFLQRALNAFSDRGTQYPAVAVDGQIGAMTVTALTLYLARRGAAGERVMIAALNAQQGVRYLDLLDANPRLGDFEYGWFANRIAD